MDFKSPGRNPRAKLGAKAVSAPVELPAGLAPRLAAAAALAEVVGSGRPLDEAFEAAIRHSRITGLSDRDRALARSIVVVSLRRLGTIRKRLASLLERGWPRKSGSLEWILVVTAAQILFLDIPDHAAVNSCVQAVRLDPTSTPFAALANAVARNLTRSREVVEDDDPFIDTPAWLATRWRRTYGEAQAAAIAAAHRREAPLDLSVKADAAQWAETLGADLLSTGVPAAEQSHAGAGPAGLCRRRLVGAGRRCGPAGPASPGRGGRKDRRPLRGPRRQDGPALCRGRAGRRGGPLGRTAQALRHQS